jgi:hypothetical protein
MDQLLELVEDVRSALLLFSINALPANHFIRAAVQNQDFYLGTAQVNSPEWISSHAVSLFKEVVLAL